MLLQLLIRISALLHESDINQLSSESFNQMIDITSKLFIVILKTRSTNDFSELCNKARISSFKWQDTFSFPCDRLLELIESVNISVHHKLPEVFY